MIDSVQNPMSLRVEYYSRCAPEYEQLWYRDDPIRQGEQAAIVAATKDLFRKRRVLEVACGTGYWTQFLAGTATRVCATDLSRQMLDLAHAKGLPASQIEFRQGDAYALHAVPGSFDAGLANFWFSHVPKARIDEFLRGFRDRLGNGAPVLMADNVYVAGLGGEFVSRWGCEDTFKLRELEDGSKHEVLKNYYDADQLRAIFGPRSSDLKIHVGTCFWWVRYLVSDA
jgi:SAM-dependent methyltransferase